MKFRLQKYSEFFNRVGTNCRGLKKFTLTDQYVDFRREGYNFGFTNTKFQIVSIKIIIIIIIIIIIWRKQDQSYAEETYMYIRKWHTVGRKLCDDKSQNLKVPISKESASFLMVVICVLVFIYNTWIKSYLSYGFSFACIVAKFSSPFLTLSGVPQGSTLGSLVFSLVTIYVSKFIFPTFYCLLII
jgi:hypothetical protein